MNELAGNHLSSRHQAHEPMSKERPILFSGPMVRAILDGRKTQTRRIVKPQPDENGLSFMPNAPLDWRDDVHGEWHPWKGETPNGDSWRGRVQCWPEDRLWVRESFMRVGWDAVQSTMDVRYRADDERRTIAVPRSVDLVAQMKWKPSIHMPRWASRITLEVTGVRVERLQDISEEDAIAEGVECWEERGYDDAQDFYRNYHTGGDLFTAKASYRTLWESINGPGSWERNDWVWVIEFKRIEP